jgi:hypothetical protein
MVFQTAQERLRERYVKSPTTLPSKLRKNPLDKLHRNVHQLLRPIHMPSMVTLNISNLPFTYVSQTTSQDFEKDLQRIPQHASLTTHFTLEICSGLGSMPNTSLSTSCSTYNPSAQASFFACSVLTCHSAPLLYQASSTTPLYYYIYNLHSADKRNPTPCSQHIPQTTPTILLIVSVLLTTTPNPLTQTPNQTSNRTEHTVVRIKAVYQKRVLNKQYKNNSSSIP